MDAVNSAVATDGGEGEIPLTMENLQGGFLLWALLTVFILVIFSLEVLRIDNFGVTSKVYKFVFQMVVPSMISKITQRDKMLEEPRQEMISPF